MDGKAKDAAIDYLLSRAIQMKESLKPLLSDELAKRLFELPSDTAVEIHIRHGNGIFIRNLTVSDLQIIFIACK